MHAENLDGTTWYRYPNAMRSCRGIGGARRVDGAARGGERRRGDYIAERVGANKRQDEPRARKSTRIRVRAALGSPALPEVRGLEKNLISDERAQPLPPRARTQGLRPAEKCATRPISTPGVRQSCFISEDPFPSSTFLPACLRPQPLFSSSTLISLPPPLLLRLLLKFNSLFGNDVLSSDMILSYYSSCISFAIVRNF